MSARPIYAQHGSKFAHNGIWNLRVTFRCGETIECRPPYVNGQLDGVWITYAKGSKLPPVTDEAAWRKLVGMKILSI